MLYSWYIRGPLATLTRSAIGPPLLTTPMRPPTVAPRAISTSPCGQTCGMPPIGHTVKGRGRSMPRKLVLRSMALTSMPIRCSIAMRSSAARLRRKLASLADPPVTYAATSGLTLLGKAASY